ncbi:MAG: hypothetical protein AAGC95_07700 [Pseudomonadota bacterium]
MGFKSKQIVNLYGAVAGALVVMFWGGAAPGAAETAPPMAGGLALGETFGGVTDRAYAMGPPNFAYVVKRSPGAFLDCGAAMEMEAHNDAGLSDVALDCGVTLSETVSVPRVGAKASLTIHY